MITLGHDSTYTLLHVYSITHIVLTLIVLFIAYFIYIAFRVMILVLLVNFIDFIGFNTSNARYLKTTCLIELTYRVPCVGQQEPVE